MKRLFFSGPCILVTLILGGNVEAEVLTSASFSSNGETVASVSGEGTTDSFKSISAGGQDSAVGEAESVSFDGDSGFAEILDNSCPPGSFGPDNPNSINSKVGNPCDLDDDDDLLPDELLEDITHLPGALSVNPDNCPMVSNVDQADFEQDQIGDVCDDDDDNDLVRDDLEDTNMDGVVDDGETDPRNQDSDGDGVNDGEEDSNQNGQVDFDGQNQPIESDPTNPDSDDDGLDDGVERTLGTSPVNGDTDDDNVGDMSDNCPLDENTDQANFDNQTGDPTGDLQGDVCDFDDDNDGVDDTIEPSLAAAFDFGQCGDIDGDLCDDCTNPVDGFGILADFDITNDGLDTDLDTVCNLGDEDDDDDGIPDVFNGSIGPDNCPLDINPDQADSDNDNIGDVCDTNDNDTLCFPIPTQSGGIAVICL